MASVFCPRVILPAMAIGVCKQTMTTLFWVGEPADSDNAFIANHKSYWDKDWQKDFGGVDHPERRNGYWPAEFRPKENPFYAALPFGEFTDTGDLKPQAREVPWFYPGLSPLLKNHWIEILLEDRSCFAQWQDVGPCGEDDFGFVFGNSAKPLNTFDAKAGLDVSPAVWHYLGLNDNCVTAWRLVDARDVPPGPWTEIITVSGNNR
jgi:hypothetical protein